MKPIRHSNRQLNKPFAINLLPIQAITIKAIKAGNIKIDAMNAIYSM